jgi:hypothetical protein
LSEEHAVLLEGGVEEAGALRAGGDAGGEAGGLGVGLAEGTVGKGEGAEVDKEGVLSAED